MPEEPDRDERVAALMRHPQSLNSMNRPGMGEFGTLCDISVDYGWVGIIERLYARFEALPEAADIRISQIKEKYGELRVYLAGYNDAIDAIIAHAEGEAARTCQICGCRGRIRYDGWIVNLCAAHWDGELGRLTRNAKNVCGADEPVANFALAAAPSFASDGKLGVEHCDLLDRGSALGYEPAYFGGLIEADALVISLEPATLQDMLGSMPFAIRSAGAVFDGLAGQNGADRQELARRIDEARHAIFSRGGPGQAARLAAIWRWLSGIDEPTAER